MNSYYFRSNHLSHNTSVKIKTQNLIIKKSKFIEFKSRKSKSAYKKPALLYINKLEKIFHQDKKKKYLKKKQD